MTHIALLVVILILFFFLVVSFVATLKCSDTVYIVIPLAGIALMGAMLGFERGRDAMTKGMISELRNSSPEGTRQVYVLRSFDRGILIRTPGTDRIEFVPWDDVKSVSQSQASMWRYMTLPEYVGRQPEPKNN